MKLINWIRRAIEGFVDYLGADRRNFILFLLSIPTIVGMYLIFVFLGSLTGMSDYIAYRKVSDYDKDLPVAQEGDIVFLDQGWQERYRRQYYFTPQGSPILPLDIAMALEMPDSDERIFAPDGPVYTKFGYLPYPAKILRVKGYKHLQSYGLPIGFTKDGKASDPMLGVNCAACHTSNIEYEGTTIRVDGGAALGDFIGLFNAIDDGLVATINDPAKFDRLANRVGKTEDKQREDLRLRLEVASAQRQAWQRRNSDGIPADNPQGHARVDAFGVIFNQTLAKDLHLDTPHTQGGNARTPDAPVSYPVLWDTPFMGRVQWNGSANNVSSGGVLGRNTGQVLGVFGGADVTSKNALPGYCSTVNRRNLQLFDYWVKALKSPLWEDAAGQSSLKTLKPELVARGKEIYGSDGKKCAACHAVPPADYRDKTAYNSWYAPKKGKQTCELPFSIVSIDKIGTDPNTVNTGTRTGAHSGVLGGQSFKKDPGKKIGTHEGNVTLLREIVAGSIAGSFQSVSCNGELNLRSLVETADGFGKIARGRLKGAKSGSEYVGKKVSGGYELTGKTEEKRGETKRVDECDNVNLMLPVNEEEGIVVYDANAYRARPLTGIWSSAPYLHNGSVPTLNDLLLPEAERAKTFYVGCSDFDPENVGFDCQEGPNTTLFDTSKSGNKNTGHTYGTNLSDDDRKALIEYLKSL